MHWRQMTPADMPDVIRIAALIHIDHPEDDDVVLERPIFFPAGCLVLDKEGLLYGYTLAHPTLFEAPPALNKLIGQAPDKTDVLHLHDLALLPEARGSGASQAAIEMIVNRARDAGFRRISIVAVNGTEPFWQKQGFEHHTSAKLTEKLASYDGGASYMIRNLTSD